MTLAVVAALALVAPGAPAARPSAPSARPGAAARLPAGSGDAHIDAEEWEYSPRKNEMIATGKPVRLTRDDAVLTCLRLVAHNDAAGKLVTATCEGDVRFTRGERVITCATATYDNPANRVICEGAPVTVREPGSDAEGSRLVYDLASDRITLKDAKVHVSGERIEAARQQQRARGKEPR